MVEDIEDLKGLEIDSREDNHEIKYKMSLRNNKTQNNDVIESKEGVLGNLPGVGNIFLETFGCAHNVSDGEYMKGILQEYGYNIVNSSGKSTADMWIVNSCTVKDPSEASFMRLVKEAKNTNKKLVVTGCVPQADRKLKGLENVSMVGVTQIQNIVSVVEDTLKGNVVKLLQKNSTLPSLNLPKIRKSDLIEIIPISTGCLGNCSYCKTKHARGKLGSYTIDAICSRVQTVLEDGVREIWLASEDTGAFGIDLNTNISELLAELLKKMEVSAKKNQMLKLGMTNPPYILAHLDKIADFLNHERVFKFIHLPVQSGSTEVLNKMKREYSISDFNKICNYLLKYVPNLTISTDIICGFPTETEEQFKETLFLVEKYKFPILNISKFYSRPGTLAATMDKIPSNIIKERSRKLTNLFNSYETFGYLLNKKVEVFFSDEINVKNKQLIGHTNNYIKVCIPYDKQYIGTKQQVLITKTTKFHVIGQLVTQITEEKY